jgi:hypothetical protein
MSQVNNEVKKGWVVIDQTAKSKTEAMAVGYGALVRDTITGPVDTYDHSRSVMTSMTYVPNVKVVPVIPTELAIDEKPVELYELVAHYPGRGE